jgi:hypothetical protein
MTAVDAPAAPEAAGAACPHDALAPYRAWVASHDGEHPSDPDPLEVLAHGGHCQPLTRHPIHAKSADLECEHFYLPSDGCPHGCFVNGRYVPTEQRASTPDLMTTFQRAKEKAMQTAPPIPAPVSQENDTDVAPDAPFGYKTDGTPRKRPAPSAEQLRKAAAGRAKAAAARNGRQRPEPAPAVTEGPAHSPVLERMIAELDAEIARLTAARDALVALA